MRSRGPLTFLPYWKANGANPVDSLLTLSIICLLGGNITSQSLVLLFADVLSIDFRVPLNLSTKLLGSG